MTASPTRTPETAATPHADGAGAVPGARGWLRPVLVGGALAVVVVLGRVAGVLDGPVGLVVATAIVLAVPTSRLLSRRIVLAVPIIFGWFPLVAWLHLPVGSLGAVTIALAVVAGALGAWVARARGRLGLVVPRLALVDGVPLVALLLAAYMLAPWLLAPSGGSAVSMLASGWDNVAHFNMAEMIRQHGTVVAQTAQPADGTWAYAHYPQGYHAMTSAVMELLGPVQVGGPALEAVLYVHALGLVFVTGIVALAAGIAALPPLRRHPGVALLGTGLVGAVFLLGPSGYVIVDGFPNFLYACVLLCLVPLLVVATPRWTGIVVLLALSGALVGIAHSWALLLTMAAPMAVVILLPLRRRLPSSWRHRAAIIAIAVASVVGVVLAVLTIEIQSIAAIMLIGGGISPRGPAEKFVIAAWLGAALVALALVVPRPRGGHVLRALGVAVGPLTGIAFTVWIIAVQAGHEGAGYYLHKYVIALELLMATVAVVAGSLALAHLHRRRRLGVPVGVALAATAGVFVLGLFGAPTTPLATSTGLTLATGGVARETLVTRSTAPAPGVSDLLAAAQLTREVAGRSVYVPLGAVFAHPGSIGQWNAALAGRWVDEVNAPIGTMLRFDVASCDDPHWIYGIVASEPDLTVIVPPACLDAARAEVDDRDRGRIRTW
ncbi:DUF6541 family protein [Cellulomonas terrae]|nr:DUF6541 family protein [Cellulomonas terrae]